MLAGGIGGQTAQGRLRIGRRAAATAPGGRQFIFRNDLANIVAERGDYSGTSDWRESPP